MGSTVSRPRLNKVAPRESRGEEGEQRPGQHQPQWTLPALPVTLEQQSGHVGRRKTTLPPLKRETAAAFSESRFAGSLPSTQRSNPSIIHSHPPRRPQALQPLALQIGHTTTATGCIDGAVHRFSTTSQTGDSGTGRLMQGGFLEAQTALSQQAHRHRRAHLRQAREQRRHKVVYTVNVGSSNKEGIQRLKLVKRPTERDIFWDETTGESLDLRYLLQPRPGSPLGEERRNVTSLTRSSCAKWKT